MMDRIVRIIPPAFDGDYWMVETSDGIHSYPYAKCATKAEAKEKASEAKEAA